MRKGITMEKKKRIVFILIVLVIGVSLTIAYLGKKRENDLSSNEKKYSIEEDNNYSINNEKILINGFSLEVPQIVYSSDKGKQRALNEILIDNIEEYFNNTGLSAEGSINNFEYSIETRSKTKLSILFTYDYYDGKAAHPFISAFAVNLDLEKKKIINLDDYKNRIKLFNQKAFSHVTKRKTSLKNDGGVLEDKSIDELLDDMDNNSFYLINNKLGIIFEVPYACGGYSIYEEK